MTSPERVAGRRERLRDYLPRLPSGAWRRWWGQIAAQAACGKIPSEHGLWLFVADGGVNCGRCGRTLGLR